jgi:phospholipid/cholesterol/gamma-HCH transport system substrate-binding protein
VESRRNEIRVGIAVLISLVMLVGGIIWGKGYRLRTSRYAIEVVFDNVSGLEAGANVLANGVTKGRVTNIILREGEVWVGAKVDKNVTLYSDCRITIESPTVMAGKVLAIYPGHKMPLADLSKPLKGIPPLGVGEVMTIFESVTNDLQSVLHNVNTLVTNLNRVAGDTINQEHLSSLLASADNVARTSDEWLTENRAQLSETLDRLETAIVEAEALVSTTQSRLGVTLAGVDSATAQINALALSLRELTDKINSDQGTVGKLLTDDELYNRLNHALAEIDSLSKSLRTQGLRTRIRIF